MPNPFPGMNPYLENPQRWRDVHGALIYRLRDALVAALPPAYNALVEERVYVQQTAKEYTPDALILEALLVPSVPKDVGEAGRDGGTATLVRPSHTRIIPSFDEPHRLVFESVTVRERFVEVRTGGNLERLVAVVELLSPTNKMPGRGRTEYLQKQSDMLNGNVHFLEIDLLRAGPYTLAPPEWEIQERLARFDYLISLHCDSAGSAFDLWPLTLRDRLPRLLIPLDENESAVVDLQAVLNDFYEASGQARRIDYNRPPVPPLWPSDAEWANELIVKTQVGDRADSIGTIETKDF